MLEKKKFLNYKFFSYFDKLSKIGTFNLAGRNFFGRICVHHRCSGKKQLLYKIDFYRRVNSYGFIYKIFKDINRTGLVGGIIYENGLFSYIILTEGVEIGVRLFSGFKKKLGNIEKGYALSLKNIKLFSVVNNVEKYPYNGSSVSRSAGTSCVLSGKKKNKRILKCKSGWLIYVSKNSIGCLGCVSNKKHLRLNLKKAGESFKLGKKSVVRGLAKNACDHPHGGGEGRKSKPVRPRSPWGWFTVGKAYNIKKYLKLKKKNLKK